MPYYESTSLWFHNEITSCSLLSPTGSGEFFPHYSCCVDRMAHLTHRHNSSCLPLHTRNAVLNLQAINAKYNNLLIILIQRSRDSASRLRNILTAVVYVNQVFESGETFHQGWKMTHQKTAKMETSSKASKKQLVESHLCLIDSSVVNYQCGAIK